MILKIITALSPAVPRSSYWGQLWRNRESISLCAAKSGKIQHAQQIQTSVAPRPHFIAEIRKAGGAAGGVIERERPVH
jgi:hypothetical protein